MHTATTPNNPPEGGKTKNWGVGDGRRSGAREAATPGGGVGRAGRGWRARGGRAHPSEGSALAFYVSGLDAFTGRKAGRKRLQLVSAEAVQRPLVLLLALLDLAEKASGFNDLAMRGALVVDDRSQSTND